MSLLNIRLLGKAVLLSKSMIYQKLSETSKYYDPQFPRPVKIGLRSVGWVKEEVDAWVQSRIASRDVGAKS